MDSKQKAEISIKNNISRIPSSNMKQLLKAKSEVTEFQRVPLGTLAKSKYGPSSSEGNPVPRKRNKFPIATYLNTRHVTLRDHFEDLNCAFIVFEDYKDDKKDVILKIDAASSTPRKQENIDEKDKCEKSDVICMKRDFTEYMIKKYLLSIEGKPMDLPKMIMGMSRVFVMNWFKNVNGPKGNPANVRYACFYLDTFIICTGNLELKKLQLTAAACYTISSKKHINCTVCQSKIVAYCYNAFRTVHLRAAVIVIAEKIFPYIRKMTREVSKVSPIEMHKQSFCEPSSSQASTTVPLQLRKFDTRHVTLRHQIEDLDWNLEMLNDDEDDKNDITMKRIYGPAEQKQKENIDEKAKWKNWNMISINRDYIGNSTESIFKYLLDVERKQVSVQICNKSRFSEITRASLINWLMKINGPNGNTATVQLASSYLDTFISCIGFFQISKPQLAAIACYSIAMTIYEPINSTLDLLKCTKTTFNADQLEAAKILIQKNVISKPRPVVPQEFIPYLAWYCDNDHPYEIEMAATFICLVGLMVNRRIAEEYPSVIAAASVENSLLLLGKHDVIPHLQLLPLYEAAAKKTDNMANVRSMQLEAIRIMESTICEFKCPLEHYGQPPNYLAQKIINAVDGRSYI